MIKRIATSLLFMLAIASTSFAQSDSERDQYAPNVVEFAAKTFTFTHVEATGHFSLAHQFEIVWGSAPATTTISVVGRMRGGTTQTLASNTLTTNQIITAFGFYDFVDISIAWTGSPTSTKLNILGSSHGYASSGGAASAANAANSFQTGVSLVDYPGQWAVFSQPVAATQATVSRAAVSTLKHVAKSVTVCISAVAAQPDIIFNLRDGATGAGTVVWTSRLAAVAGTSQCVTANFTIVGTLNTAMTLESSAAPAATNFATVSVSGYDIQ